MSFEYLYILSAAIFFLCFMSIGLLLLSSYKSKMTYLNYNSCKLNRIKSLDYDIHLDSVDFRQYEKYEIWRLYFPD